ncbi:macrophage erythroblast attacher [Cystoisospora suis]|uniref:Macrophage erythroblast attacher n=1 Tax=Cystoisospora suis TaxID=483139 RepID=A0A2C6LB11_9APIC|nr:macrophage erythroblast attacher [Cystoisospora suis]
MASSSFSAVRASGGGLPSVDSPPTAGASAPAQYQPPTSNRPRGGLHLSSSFGEVPEAGGHCGRLDLEEEQRKATGGAGRSSASFSSVLASHSPLHSVDRAFLRVPVECGLRSLKAHSRRLHRDIAVVLAYILKGKMATQLMNECPTVEDKMNKVDLVIEKLQKIRDKALRGSEESRAFLIRCQMRVRRLAEEPDIQEIHTKADFSFSTYEDRTAWVVHEYLVRSGMADTAQLLKHKLGLEAYTDTEVYQEVLDVLGGLLRQSTQEALDWVAEHRQKLKKLGSPFESELHVQHVLELLKKKDAKAAVTYLKSNVGPDDFGRCADIRKVVTLTALLEDPPPQYAVSGCFYYFGQEACGKHQVVSGGVQADRRFAADAWRLKLSFPGMTWVLLLVLSDSVA